MRRPPFRIRALSYFVSSFLVAIFFGTFSLAQTAPKPAAKAADTTSEKTVSYACENRFKLNVTFTGNPPVVAHVQLGNDTWDLPRSKSGPGIRYVDADKKISFSTRGNTAVFDNKGDKVHCDVIQY